MLFALPLSPQTNGNVCNRYFHERTFIVPVNLANSDPDNCSCITITGISVYPGSECWKRNSISPSITYEVQSFLQSAKHQFTCSRFTWRRNSQLGFYLHMYMYLFRHLYTLGRMFLAELILCLLHPLLWLDGQKKMRFAKELVQKCGRTVQITRKDECHIQLQKYK